MVKVAIYDVILPTVNILLRFDKVSYCIIKSNYGLNFNVLADDLSDYKIHICSH